MANKSKTARVITRTKSRGIIGVSPVLWRSEAEKLAKDLKDANPVWVSVEVESCTDETPDNV